jgi:hypothetical protein
MDIDVSEICDSSQTIVKMADQSETQAGKHLRNCMMSHSSGKYIATFEAISAVLLKTHVWLCRGVLRFRRFYQSYYFQLCSRSIQQDEDSIMFRNVGS